MTVVISEAIFEKIASALNRAIALATRFEPELTESMIEASIALDNAANGMEDDDH